MKEYHKIETVFERDMEGTKKLVLGRFRNPVVAMLQDVLWVGKEKVDGTNIRIHWDGHTVEVGGRTDRAQLPMDLVDYVRSVFCTPQAEQLFEQLFGEKEVYLYGEGYGAGIQKGGGLYRKDKGFILFDVEVCDVFLDIHDVEDIARAFGVPAVPVLTMGTLHELVNYVRNKPLSQCAEEKRVIEGIVAVPRMELRDKCGRRIIVKIKVEDFE